VKPIRAVIFDLDGLMINTEELAFVAWLRALAPLGYTLKDADFQAMVGLDEDASVAYIQRATGMVDGHVDLESEFHQHMYVLFETELKPNPGLPELVAALASRHLPMGIASNSPQEHVRRALGHIGMAKHFSAIVSRDQVAQGKPAPDPYLAAARLLDIEPAFCLAIEDSPVGMQSALAAGMRCAVVSAQARIDPACASATARYETLNDLHAALEFLL
jgi:HAD superfamily hydrolase (TIGR01509 family)